jgi:hypothetical protein
MPTMIFNLIAVCLCGIAAILIRHQSSFPLTTSHAFESGDRRRLLGRVLLGIAAFCAVLGFVGAFHPNLH